MKITATTLSILGFASQAFAHYRFTTLHVNGKAASEFQYIRKWTPIYNNGPVEDVTLESIRCNVNPSAAEETLTISAGSQIGFSADQAVLHPGPYMAYLAKAPSGVDISSWDGNGDWFKIFELGATSISSSGITWDNTAGPWNFNIPKDTPSGSYLLRFEHIGLHAAGAVNGAQHYMSCAQLNIVDGGNGVPGPTIKFPGGYKSSDPGILINIYYPVPTSYIIPGPKVWSSGSSGSTPVTSSTTTSTVATSTTAAPTTLVTSARPTTTSTSATVRPTTTTTSTSTTVRPTTTSVTVRPTTTSARPVPTGGAGVRVSEWNQCGGKNFKGATQCGQGLICKEWNPYYFQCIKA